MNIISHNLAAMNASRQFHISANTQKKATEKLSSGYRINRAADDAAGLSISEKMRGQIRGLSQGVENTQAGVSLCQVADGALAEVNDMLQRITELSVQSANGTNSASDRNAIQEEINQLLQEINRISDTTTFNEQPIFKEETPISSIPGNAQTHVGAIQNSIKATSDGFTATDKASNPSGTISADAYGVSCNGYSIPWSQVTDGNGNSLADTPLVGGDYSFNLYESLSNYVDVKVAFSVNTGAAIDDVIASIDGMTYSLTQHNYEPITITNPELSVGSDSDNFLAPSNLGLNKKFIADATGITLNGYGSMTWEQMGIDVNNPSGKTGTFTDSKSGVSFSFTTVANTTMDDIIEAFNKAYVKPDIFYNQFNGFFINEFRAFKQTSDSAYTTLASFASISPDGLLALGYTTPSQQLNASFDVTFSGNTTSDLKVTIAGNNGNSIDIPYSDWVLTDAGVNFYGPRFQSSYGTIELHTYAPWQTPIPTPEPGLISLIGSIGTTTIDSPIRQYYISPETHTIPNGATVDITLPTQGSASDILSPDTNGGTNQVFIQSGCDTMDGIILEIDRMSTQSLGIEDVNVSTVEGADRAITVMDMALKRLSATRSKIGAQQNRLEHTIANEENIIENTTASESRIRDTDMATELVKHSTNNILLQAGQAMLAQANHTSQGILQLLQ